MADRRSLAEGLAHQKQEKAKEEAFVYGASKTTVALAAAMPAQTQAGGPPGRAVRVALNTRIRPDLAAALKRISLERQLAGAPVSAVQDIVEEALEGWLGANASN